jgi:hypothetical protein
MGPHFGPPPIFMFFFVAIFVVVIGGILFSIGKGVSEWSSNNAQPELTVDAEIVSKRTEVSGREHSTSTTYYSTFEMEGGARLEVKLSGHDYGQFAEGDTGRLSYQGTRFLGFVRQVRPAEALPVMQPAPPPNLQCAYCGNAIPAGKIQCAGCGWTWKPARLDDASA